MFAFVPFGEHGPQEGVCCDGLVDGCKLQLSHWAGNATPPALKRDTSVEIALAAIDDGVRAKIVANNHFDADGVIAVFVLLHPEIAREHRDVLVAAAEAGDFDEWTTEEGMKLEMAVRRLSELVTERVAYERALAALPDLAANVAKYTHLWGSAWDALLAGEARADRDATFDRIGDVALVVHRGEELPGAVVSKRTRGAKRILWAFERDGGFEYLYEQPRHAWADTVKRASLAKPSRNALARDLGEGWALKGELGMTGLLRTRAPIALAPREVVTRLLANETSDVAR